jgi:hypothetical protein
MALYGIDGLMPAATMLSADNMSVRTLYRLESGETVELVQRRAAAPAGARGAAANASTPTFRSGTETQPAGAAAPATWTTVRDEMQLTLQGTADLAALGGRLRLE